MRRSRSAARGVTLLEAIVAAALLLVVLGGVVAFWSGGLVASGEQTAVVALAGEAHRATADLALAIRNADPGRLVVVRRGASFTDPTTGRAATAPSDMLMGIAEALPGAAGEPLRVGVDGLEGRTAWVLAAGGALVRRRLAPSGAVEAESTLVRALARDDPDAFRLVQDGARIEVEVRTQAGAGADRPLRASRTAAVLRNGAPAGPGGGTP